MHALYIVFSSANTILLVLVAALAILRWRRRRDNVSAWLATAFFAIALLVTLGRAVPAHPHGVGGYFEQRLEIELLVLFPYLIYRFATEFVPPGRRLQLAVASLTVGLSVFTFALSHLPSAGERWPTAFVIYAVAFFVHWSMLSVVVTVRLWRAGSGLPAVAGKRMRMLSFASAMLTIALLGTTFASNKHSVGAAVVEVLGFVAISGFYLGVEPPRLVRTLWREHEAQRLQAAMRGLVTLAITRQEIAERMVVPAAQLVGARSLALYGADGELLARHGTLGSADEAIEIVQPGVRMVAWTSPYAPFFGEDELRALQTICALTATALDRVRLFEQEHQSRLALERANELMTNFVALAAHELRTPVTTIHGFVQTLNHLGARLTEEQKEELRAALEQQTRRMAALVEQLLDLSRLDAEAVVVRPQPVDVRARLAEVVAIAAGARRAEVELDVPEPSRATIDPDIFDHIVGNLVTNALRYGRAPIRVTAQANNGTLRVAVQDDGDGVAPEIEATLFERFIRAGVAKDRVAGTGLGLAIAQAYARAHEGELRYERGEPRGARFVVELPNV